MSDHRLLFKMKRELDVRLHHLKQLEMVAIAQQNELEVMASVACGWAFDLAAGNPEPTEAEKRQALEERFANEAAKPVESKIPLVTL